MGPRLNGCRSRERRDSCLRHSVEHLSSYASIAGEAPAGVKVEISVRVYSDLRVFLLNRLPQRGDIESLYTLTDTGQLWFVVRGHQVLPYDA
jgi:hypothetical protein